MSGQLVPTSRKESATIVPTGRKMQHQSLAALRTKVAQRLAALPPGDPVRVLDAYGGDGDIWRHVARLTDTPVEVTSIDQTARRRTQLAVDNRRYLASADLSRFDVIDLDAWGFPAEQLAIVADQQYPGTIHYTACSMSISLTSHAIIAAAGIPLDWLKTVTYLIHRRASQVDQWLEFCSRLGFPDHVVAETADGGARYAYGACGDLTHWTPARQTEADKLTTREVT